MSPSLKSAMAQLVRERMVRPLLPDGVSSDLNRNDRVGAVHRAWGYVFTSQMEGAYYEMGVSRGATFRASYQTYQIIFNWQQQQLLSDEPWRRQVAAQYAHFRHHFYAFDTFEGIPENDEGNPTFPGGACACSLEEFTRLNREAGVVEGPTVRYFRGTFKDIAAREAPVLPSLQPAAIVNIDCDLYVSTLDALGIVAPHFMQGTVILADDWNTDFARRDKGERRAFSEFLDAHPEWSFEPWCAYHFTGQAFLVHRNSP